MYDSIMLRLYNDDLVCIINVCKPVIFFRTPPLKSFSCLRKDCEKMFFNEETKTASCFLSYVIIDKIFFKGNKTRISHKHVGWIGFRQLREELRIRILHIQTEIDSDEIFLFTCLATHKI